MLTLLVEESLVKVCDGKATMIEVKVSSPHCLELITYNPLASQCRPLRDPVSSREKIQNDHQEP